jgi:hypothetical protein
VTLAATMAARAAWDPWSASAAIAGIGVPVRPRATKVRRRRDAPASCDGCGGQQASTDQPIRGPFQNAHRMGEQGFPIHDRLRHDRRGWRSPRGTSTWRRRFRPLEHRWKMRSLPRSNNAAPRLREPQCRASVLPRARSPSVALALGGFTPTCPPPPRMPPGALFWSFPLPSCAQENFDAEPLGWRHVDLRHGYGARR